MIPLLTQVFVGKLNLSMHNDSSIYLSICLLYNDSVIVVDSNNCEYLFDYFSDGLQ